MSDHTIAFLGATGGCVGFCLAAALSEGKTCRALARNPAKLRASLSSRGVSNASLEQLQIVEGNAKDTSAVKTLLTARSGNTVDTIVFGIGGSPVLRFHFYPVSLDDPTICEQGMACVMSALAELKSEKKPRLIALSTTGVNTTVRDIPLAYMLFYHWMLHVPHNDKRRMENLMWSEKEKPEQERLVKDFVVVRPQLLMDGPGKGADQVRYGTRDKPAIGYTIDRKDVGEWIYSRLVKQADIGVMKDNAMILAA